MTEEIRELYYITLSALVPTIGNETIAARDAKHARELITEKYKKYQDFKIIDVFKVKDCPEIIQAAQKDQNKEDKN